jgi:hypothetical protein
MPLDYRLFTRAISGLKRINQFKMPRQRLGVQAATSIPSQELSAAVSARHTAIGASPYAITHIPVTKEIVATPKQPFKSNHQEAMKRFRGASTETPAPVPTTGKSYNPRHMYQGATPLGRDPHTIWDKVRDYASTL